MEKYHEKAKCADGSLRGALSSGAAWAWNNVTGTVTSIDPQNHELVLNDGKTYTVESNVKLAGLKAGDKVKVSIETKNGANLVNKVEPMS